MWHGPYPSVCHKPAFCGNGWMNPTGIRHKGYTRIIRHCSFLISYVITIFPEWNSWVGFWFYFFPYFSFLGRALDYAGQSVSFWAHANLPYSIVSLSTSTKLCHHCKSWSFKNDSWLILIHKLYLSKWGYDTFPVSLHAFIYTQHGDYNLLKLSTYRISTFKDHFNRW